MADGDQGTAGTGTATAGGGYTKQDLDNIAAAARRAEAAKYSDYDALKAKAAEADKTKSDVDKLTDAVRALTERAEKAERETTRREVADKHKLPKSFAKKLSGTTAEDLDREAAELVAELKELGVKFDGDGDGDGKGKDGKGATGGGDAGKDGKGDAAGNGGEGGGDAGRDSVRAQLRGEVKDGKGSNGATGAGGRPEENLRSGANPSGGGGEALDHNKMADEILGSKMF
jgi:hypothetical protein